jgi:hypothetical protein
VVSVPSHANGMTLDTTWHQCFSYECAQGKCAAPAITAQRGLADAFIAYLRDQPRSRSTAMAETPQAPSPSEGVASAVTHATVNTASKLVLNARPAFFLLYILTCLAVLARWEFTRLVH